MCFSLFQALPRLSQMRHSAAAGTRACRILWPPLQARGARGAPRCLTGTERGESLPRRADTPTPRVTQPWSLWTAGWEEGMALQSSCRGAAAVTPCDPARAAAPARSGRCPGPAPSPLTSAAPAEPRQDGWRGERMGAKH